MSYPTDDKKGFPHLPCQLGPDETKPELNNMRSASNTVNDEAYCTQCVAAQACRHDVQPC